MVSWFQGVIHGRYDFPFFSKGVPEPAARKRVRPSLKQLHRSLKMRISALSCPGTGQVRRINGTLEHVFTDN